MQFRVTVDSISCSQLFQAVPRNMLPVVSTPRCCILNLVRINNTTLCAYIRAVEVIIPLGSYIGCMDGPPRPFSPRAAKYLMQTLLVDS